MQNIRSMWDRAPTDAEIGYSRRELDREHYADLIEGQFAYIGRQPMETLGLPFISYRNGTAEKKLYPMLEAFEDYGTYDDPQKAFVAMLENSKCPFVAAFKQAVCETFKEHNLEELVEVLREE